MEAEIILGIICFILGIIVSSRFNKKENERLQSELSLAYNENFKLNAQLRALHVDLQERKYKIDMELKQREIMECRRSELIGIYDGKPLRFLFYIPANITVADGGYPVVKGWRREDYWVYKSWKGECFHRQSCGLSGLTTAVRIWDVPPLYRPCLQCNPKTADFKWYRELRDVEKRANSCGLRVVIRDGIMHMMLSQPEQDTSHAEKPSMSKDSLTQWMDRMQKEHPNLIS